VTPAWLRPRAEADLVDRSRYYVTEAGDEIGERFFDVALAALRSVERMPGIGTLRVAELCDIPGLRMRRIIGLPCGWYYLVRPDHLDVVRLLADTQDLAAILDDLDDLDDET